MGVRYSAYYTYQGLGGWGKWRDIAQRISSGNLKYNMGIIVNNIVLYTWNANRVDFKCPNKNVISFDTDHIISFYVPPEMGRRGKGLTSAVREVILFTQGNSVPHPVWLKADLGKHGIYHTDHRQEHQLERAV